MNGMNVLQAVLKRKVAVLAVLLCCLCLAVLAIFIGLFRHPTPFIDAVKQNPITRLTTSPLQRLTPAAPAHESTVNNVVFSDAFGGADRIVTNEFVHFSPNDGCPYTSSAWDMTSGTLLIKDGTGYSGVPTLEKQSVCNSSVHNNSAIFRLNTKSFNFSNVVVSLDYKAVQHGGGGAPNNSYDGIHIWVGYQSQYALYAASIFRWDGNLVIKKKVPAAQAKCSSPANDGCYYDLSKEAVYKDATTSQVWHHADISFIPGGNGTTTIKEVIDSKQIFAVTDNSVSGKNYTTGAVGIRGDNTEFYFKNFSVTRL